MEQYYILLKKIVHKKYVCSDYNYAKYLCIGEKVKDNMQKWWGYALNVFKNYLLSMIHYL